MNIVLWADSVPQEMAKAIITLLTQPPPVRFQLYFMLYSGIFACSMLLLLTTFLIVLFPSLPLLISPRVYLILIDLLYPYLNSDFGSIIYIDNYICYFLRLCYHFHNLNLMLINSVIAFSTLFHVDFFSAAPNAGEC